MRVRLAKTAGFCMGVRRAVDIALDLRRKRPPLPIVTYGPLIHNPQTLELLRSRGIEQVRSLDEITRGTVIIRAHGVSPQEKTALEGKGVTVIDATCPRVSRVQAVIRKHAGQGHFCVIVGDEDHPEVRGLLGYASAGGLVIASPEQQDLIDSLDPTREVCVVAQTTQEPETFAGVVDRLRKRGLQLHVHDTICDSTRKRQAEIRSMANQADLIVVVGGRGSANTRRLVKVAEQAGVRAVHVETADELPPSVFSDAGIVGVTAGASTPNWQIQGVISRLKEVAMSRAATPLRRLRKAFDVSVMTYVWAGAGGGGLTAACLTLQGREVTWLPPAMAALFVFSMHLLTRVMERTGAVRFNTPEIAAFYARHKVFLTALGVVSSSIAVLLGALVGMYTLILLSTMIVGALLYSMPLSAQRGPIPRTRLSLKEIPRSKTPLVALGWAMAASVLPVIDSWGELRVPALVCAFVFAAGMIFWRTALSDLMDLQGDRIVGRETIPILIGVKKTERLLRRLLIVLTVFPVVTALAGWTDGVGYLLALNSLALGGVFVVYRRGQLVDRLVFEGLVDGNLVIAGAVSIIYAWALGVPGKST